MYSRQLKRPVLHRKKAFVFRTLNGYLERVGVLFMSLSHLTTVRRQLVLLSARVTAARQGSVNQITVRRRTGSRSSERKSRDWAVLARCWGRGAEPVASAGGVTG